MRQSSVKFAPGGEQALHRRQAGTRITVAGKALWAITRSLEKREREFVPDGPRNAADGDARVFNVSPADFLDRKGELAAPTAGSPLTWQGMAYTVTRAVLEDPGGVPVALRLYAYRTPPAGQDPDETRQLGRWPEPPD